MQPDQLYRPQALDRLASPDRLDVPLRLVSRPARLLLGAIILTMAAGLAWAAFTKLPVRVSASGLLINPVGLSELVATEPGRLDALLVKAGDRVRKGQAVAVLARGELGRELQDARAQLAAAQTRLARLKAFQSDQVRREGTADTARRATLAQGRSALADRQRFLQDKIAQSAALVKRGFITRQQQVDLEIELARVRERIAELDEAALRVDIDANARAERAALALLDEQRTVDERQRLLERLTARLGDEGVIRAPAAGQVTEVKLNAGDIVAAGTPLATLTPDADKLVALLYVPAADGKRIQPGMAVEIQPSTVERALYGHIRGTVLAVAPLPATAAGMRRLLRNDQLVTELTAGGAPVEVRVALERDAGTASGFAWSASKGPATHIGAGTIVSGRVVVEERRMIGLLLPGNAR